LAELAGHFTAGRIEGLPTTTLYDGRGILRNKIVGFEYTSMIESNLKPLLADVRTRGGAAMN
jgi:hypothetical protein